MREVALSSMRDTLEHFSEPGAEDCYGTISRCNKQVRSRIDELKPNTSKLIQCDVSVDITDSNHTVISL